MPPSIEGREGVKRELGFAFFRGWEMGFCALAGIVGFELGFEKNNFLLNGIRTPPSRPSL